ncbi:MAG: extracellular solute-binding protein family 1 [Eubacterium sp.]|jgi:raffinose/stachyose/melibiose transport system substrate-binding protein|nr:extracellular solute-binding protein family 1 [Eubacterium sp.]
MKKSLRATAVLVAVTVTVSLLASCSTGERAKTSTSTSPENSSENVNPAKRVKFRASSFFTGGDAWTASWQEGIKDYIAANPNVEIIDDSTPAASDAFKTKINTDFASGNEPAVTYGFTGEIGKPLITSGKLMAWEEEMAKDPEWSKNIASLALEAVKYEGIQYAVPYLGSFEVMYYNKDLFEDNNIKVPSNWDEMLAAVDAFNKLEITPIACSFSQEPHYIIELAILSMGGKDGHDRAFDASWAPALDRIKELYDRNAFTKDAFTIKQNACEQLMKDKRAAMFISGSWSIPKLEGSNTDVMTWNLLPRGKADPTSMISTFSSGWYVTEKGNKDTNGEGVKFVKYMTSPDRAAKFFKVGGVPAINCQVEGTSPLFRKGMDLLAQAKVITKPVGDVMNQQAFTHIWKNLPYVMTDKKTSQQLLNEAQKLAK